MAVIARGYSGASGTSGPAANGLRVLTIFLGVFLISEGVSKLAWLTDSSILSQTLQTWLKTSNHYNRWYLEAVTLPGVPLFARLVPLAEMLSGIALLTGVWSRMAACAAFLMVLNFHFASGAIFQPRFLINGFGLPVLGGLLAIVIGSTRLPWSPRL